MNSPFQVIDEVSFNVLGTFPSREAAIDFVATLLTVNTDEFLDELSISDDECPPLTGDALRNALKQRAATRKRGVSPTGGGSHSSGESGHGTLVAKGYQ
jgi:hypothetical protein